MLSQNGTGVREEQPTEQEIIFVLTKEIMNDLITLMNDRLVNRLMRLASGDRRTFSLIMKENTTLMVETMFVIVGSELIYFLAFLSEDEIT